MPIHNVADAMNDLKAGSTHIKTRAQAIAVGLKAEGKSKPVSGSRSAKKPAAARSAASRR